MPFMEKNSRKRISTMNDVPMNSSPGRTSTGTLKCSKIWWNRQILSMLRSTSTTAAPMN